MDNPTIDGPGDGDKHSTYVDVGGATSRKEKKQLEPATEPYAGMGKEDLLRFSQTPFWSRLRMICLVLFWMMWLGLLVAVIVLTIIMPRCATPTTKVWSEHSVMYDVYVPSFYDTNGDGMGDIKGVTEKLDYIKTLQVDGVALSPIYASDVGDFTGIMDHTKVDAQLGNLADIKQLVTTAHDKNLKVILDFVPNHTSKKHAWFIESAQTANHTENPYWNFYTWGPCTVTKPTNNWLSVYGEPAWEYIDRRDECVLHTFLKDEPALNLRSSQVQELLEEILKYWMNETGVDGFRVRSASFLSVDADLRNEEVIADCTQPNLYKCLNHTRTRIQTENYEMINRWRRVVDAFGGDRILAVESSDSATDSAEFFGGPALIGAQLPINSLLSQPDPKTNVIRDMISDWLAVIPSGGTATWATASSEIGRQEALPVAALHMLKLTLPGTVFTYYGEELGMRNGNLTGVSVDPAGLINKEFSRDPYRSPMQWNSEENGGFTNATAPWLAVNDDGITAEGQEEDIDSLLNLFKKVTTLRTEEETLQHGDFKFAVTTENVLSFTRQFEGMTSFVVALNLSEEDITEDFSSKVIPDTAEVVVTTSRSVAVKEGDIVSMSSLKLKAGEGVILKWGEKI